MNQLVQLLKMSLMMEELLISLLVLTDKFGLSKKTQTLSTELVLMIGITLDQDGPLLELTL